MAQGNVRERRRRVSVVGLEVSGRESAEMQEQLVERNEVWLVDGGRRNWESIGGFEGE